MSETGGATQGLPVKTRMNSRGKREWMWGSRTLSDDAQERNVPTKD